MAPEVARHDSEHPAHEPGVDTAPALAVEEHPADGPDEDGSDEDGHDAVITDPAESGDGATRPPAREGQAARRRRVAQKEPLRRTRRGEPSASADAPP